MREMLSRDRVRSHHVKRGVSGGRCLVDEHLVLLSDRDKFRLYTQAFVTEVDADPPAQWRNSRQRLTRRKLGAHVIDTGENIDVFVDLYVQAQFDPDKSAIALKRSEERRVG